MYAGREMTAKKIFENSVSFLSLLNKQIAFLDIPKVIQETMLAYQPAPLTTIEEVLEVDQWARRTAEEMMKTCVAPA